jgi:hypothetical protein
MLNDQTRFGSETSEEGGETDLMTVQHPTPVQIAARAYQIYLERGRVAGYDMDDWLQAEYELMQLPVRKLAEIDPPQIPKDRPRRKSIVELVRTALY